MIASGKMLIASSLTALMLFLPGPAGHASQKAASEVHRSREGVSWPQARFRPNHKGVNPFETTLSPSTVGGLHQLWATPLGGDVGVSAPTVVNGVVYIGSFDHNVYALNAQTGSILWATPTDDFEEATPAVSDGVVYAHSNGGTLYAMDAATGHILWTSSPGHAVSSPTIAGNVVFVNGYFAVHAYDAQTGGELWTSGPIDLAVNGPTVADGRVFVADEGGIVSAFDQFTGATIWQRPASHGESFQFSTPAASGTRVFVSGEFSGTVYEFNAATGRPGWQVDLGTSGMDTSPAVSGHVVYLAGYGGDSAVYALDASTGATL